MSKGARRVDLRRFRDGACRADVDVVVEECAIALSYNGVAHAVMMATPTDLDDFALGFSLHEGIVSSLDECRSIDATRRDAGWVIDIAIPQQRFDALAAMQRRLIGNSACGLCGTESLAVAMRPAPAVDAGRIAAAEIVAALDALPAMQRLNAVTGGAHAAAWCDASGIRLLREDVGRHGAFDKLGGALAHAGIDAAAGFAIVSSRASHELVHKAAMSGIGTLVAISAPTSAAVDLAMQCGMRLIAFARDGAMNLYTRGFE